MFVITKFFDPECQHALVTNTECPDVIRYMWEEKIEQHEIDNCLRIQYEEGKCKYCMQAEAKVEEPAWEEHDEKAWEDGQLIE